MAQIVAIQTFKTFECFLLDFFALCLFLLEILLSGFNCIRNCVELVIFGVFVPYFEIPSRDGQVVGETGSSYAC